LKKTKSLVLKEKILRYRIMRLKPILSLPSSHFKKRRVRIRKKTESLSIFHSSKKLKCLVKLHLNLKSTLPRKEETKIPLSSSKMRKETPSP